MNRRAPRRLLPSLLLVATLAAPTRPTSAGEVVGCSAQGELGVCSEPVLRHVGFKSVVLQFVDPKATNLGEGLARLLWREVLESISDLAGAGVILAYDRQGEIDQAMGGRDYREVLERDYHAAAERIASQLGAQMSIWGVVLPDGEDLYLQSFLTLHAGQAVPWTSLSISRPPGGEISAAISRQRLNLAPYQGTRKALFERSWVTRCALSAGCPGGVDLRAEPSNDAPVVAKAPVGAIIEGRDMVRQWLEIARPGGGRAYINIYHVEMFPDRVVFSGRRAVRLRAAADARAPLLANVDLDGEYRVLGAVRGGRREPWYRISVGGREGWVAGRLVERRSFLFPAVHLINGLYRYRRGQFGHAVRELEAFLAVAGELDNVTRAVAYQFLAAARIASHPDSTRSHAEALTDLDTAAGITPFDPAAYRMRTLVKLGGGDVEGAVADLDRALSLDDGDPDSLRLLDEMLAASRRQGLQSFARGHDVGAGDQLLLRLEAHYARK